MVSKVERTVGARLVLDEDERSVLSAFKTVITEVLAEKDAELAEVRPV